MLKRRRRATWPIPVTRAVRKLGSDIRDARRRRRIPTTVMAQRASISHVTLIKVERGDLSVSVGAYASLLFILGVIDRLTSLADARYDTVGLMLEEEKLPKRIRGSRSAKTSNA